VHEDNPSITSVCFAPNGRYVLAFSTDSCLRLWDYVSGTVKKTYQGHINKAFSIGGCFGTIDNQPFIAAPSEDGDVVLWDVRTKEVVQRLSGGHKGVCYWVDVSGDVLVSAGQEGKIRVYRHQRPAIEEPTDVIAKTAGNTEGATSEAAVEAGEGAENGNVDAMALDGDSEEDGDGAAAQLEREANAQNGVKDEGGETPLKEEDVKEE
jgi:COMPASS component SWD3